MNGVDLADQLRHNYTIHRKQEKRVWRPLFYFLLNVCLVNAYLLFKAGKEDCTKRGQRPYRDAVAEALLNTLYQAEPKLPQKPGQIHQWSKKDKRGYCVWCKAHLEEWIPKRAGPERPPLASIVNGVHLADKQLAKQRQSRASRGCQACGVYLCQKGRCFEAFHEFCI
jgi:Transposase IS4